MSQFDDEIPTMRRQKCNQATCPEKPVYRFTWPGRDEETICEQHSVKLKNIADALGLHLQLIPLEEKS